MVPSPKEAFMLEAFRYIKPAVFIIAIIGILFFVAKKIFKKT
jgi:hypothetical protein